MPPAMRADARASFHTSANACTHYRVSRHGKDMSDLGVPRDTKKKYLPSRMG